MSYILEALKKSQQERELGRVPTLESAGVFEKDKVAPSHGRWPLLAVALAAFAMIVALYAAVRGPVQVPAQPPAAGDTARSSGVAPGAESGLAKPRGPGDAVLDGAMVATAAPAGGGAGPSPALSPTPPTGSGVAASPPARPLIEPPPLQQAGRIRPFDPMDGMGHRRDLEGSDPGPIRASSAEAELERQLEAERVEPWYEDEVLEPAPTPVPQDLIADIESFKRELRGARGPDNTPPKTLSRLADKDLLGLRLTPAQEAELPSYLMTVHVYDADRGRRFIVVNGVKYREGDKTREGLTVERILTQGAVLSHRGNPFFVPR